MIFMNEWEVDTAARKFIDHPVLGPATGTLTNLVAWTNENSDGWAYWLKPIRAAAKLQALIMSSTYRTDPVIEPTAENLADALRPIKAFRTRMQNQGKADPATPGKWFVIEEGE